MKAEWQISFKLGHSIHTFHQTAAQEYISAGKIGKLRLQATFLWHLRRTSITIVYTKSKHLSQNFWLKAKLLAKHTR